MFKMDLEYKKEILFIRLEGNLTRKSYYKINNYILPAIKKHKIKYLVCNFKKLKSIDEGGVDCLLKTKCQIKNNQGKIYFCECKLLLKEKLQRLKIKFLDSENTATKLIEVKM